MKRLLVLPGLAALLFSVSVNAGNYIGVDVSMVEMDYDAPLNTIFENDDTGYGFQFGDAEALASFPWGGVGYEVSYTDFGNYDGVFGLKLESQAVNGWLTAHVSPFALAGNPVRIEGRIGQGLYKTQITSGFFNDSDMTTGLAYGVGVLVPLTTHLDINLGKRWHEFDYTGFDLNPEEWRLGFRYNF